MLINNILFYHELWIIDMYMTIIDVKVKIIYLKDFSYNSLEFYFNK